MHNSKNNADEFIPLEDKPAKINRYRSSRVESGISYSNRLRGTGNPDKAGPQFYNRTKRERDSSATASGDHVNGNLCLENELEANSENHPTSAEIPDSKRCPAMAGTLWNPTSKLYATHVIGLHEEIEDFFRWMVPTKTEHSARLMVVKRLRQVITDLWPECKVDIFGSFKTGLYLPTSDIDLVIIGNWEQLPIYTLHERLIKSGIPRIDKLLVLDKAAVPIVKLTDDQTGVKVDISFNTNNGVRAATLIKFYKQTFPPLAKLIYVLKQFLLQRNLNEVFTGGVSSYALILMAVSFLQNHPRPDTKTHQTNLAVLLIEFFELYGINFNYSQTAIRVKDGGEYVPRVELMNNMNSHAACGGVTLCLEDPLDAKNDVGRGSFLFYRVKAAFEDAYISLTKLCKGAVDQTSTSLLSHILSISNDVITFRRKFEAIKRPLTDSMSLNQVNQTGGGASDKEAAAIHESFTAEDPVTPIYLPPSPSSNVTPNELPDRHFLQVESKENGKEVCFKVHSEVVASVNCADNLDNMSGVSTATSIASSCVDSDGVNSAMSISPANSEIGGQFKCVKTSTQTAKKRTSLGKAHKRLDRADLDPDWRSNSDSSDSPHNNRADKDPNWRNHKTPADESGWRLSKSRNCAPGQESDGTMDRRVPGFAATAVQLAPPTSSSGSGDAQSLVDGNNVGSDKFEKVTNDNYDKSVASKANNGNFKPITLNKKRKKRINKVDNSGGGQNGICDVRNDQAQARFSCKQGPQQASR